MAPKASSEISSTPGLDREAMVYEAFASIPSIGKVWMNPTADQKRAKVSMEVVQKDVPQNAVRKSLVHCLIDASQPKAQHLDTFSSTSLDNIVFTTPSPSGSKTLVVRKSDADKGSVIQMWNQATVEYELVVPEKLHGPIVNDGWFGSRASWSADELFVAYVAERPKTRQTPEWGDGFGKGRGSANGDGDEDVGEAKAKGRVWRGVGEFEEDWGEANTGKQAPAVFVLDVVARTVTMAVEPDAEKSYGQPVWSPDCVDGNHLVYVQWSHSSSIFPNMTQRLGIVYCFNRPCEMLVRAWPGEARSDVQKVNTGLMSAFSPRFTGDGDLVFLSQENAVRTGTHSATPEVHSKTWSSVVGGTADTRSFKYAGQGDFPGMYASVLSDAPALTLDGHAVLFATVQWRSKTTIVALDVINGEIFRACPDGELNGGTDALDPSSSWAFLGASSNGYVLAQASAPNEPCRLFAKQILSLESLADPTAGWQEVCVPGVVDSGPELVRTALGAISASIAEISAFDADINPIKTFEATLIGPNRVEKAPRPTLLVPHGGPHTAYSTQFIPSISFLAACGYNVITVNYRGSTGFGEASLQSLPGRIGTADVRDCLSALEHFVSEGAVLPEQVAVVGGSHGGFLTGHLIGQFPDVFKAAVMRNPVCNISLMVHLTDIPDWCYIETFGSEEGFSRAQARNTMNDLIAMEHKSPVQYVDSVKAAVLMMLGACDRRVPMDDGKRYISRLKQSDHAPDARIIVFEKDEHGLTRPQTDFEQWITCVWWLRRHGCGTGDAL